MKTIYINPRLNDLPLRKSHEKATRNNNCITLDSPSPRIMKRQSMGNRLYFVKLNNEEDELHKLETILPAIRKNNIKKFSELDLPGSDSILDKNEKLDSHIKKFQRNKHSTSPESTFYIYDRDSLVTGLRMYQENRNKNMQKQKKKSFNSELVGEQKTVYRKPFIERSFRATKSLQVSQKKQQKTASNPAVRQENEKKFHINKFSQFTPWATITENDFD